jgi:hypothetical protein
MSEQQSSHDSARSLFKDGDPLVSALVWEVDRAVKQAMRYGGQYDTVIRHILNEHLGTKTQPSRIDAAAEPTREETIEEIAKWLHDETEHPNSYPGHTWPETDRDDGQREGGFVKIVPAHGQAYFRDIARRLITIRALSKPRGEPAREGGEDVAAGLRQERG